MKEEKEEKAKLFTEKNVLMYADMADNLRRGVAKIHYAEADGLLYTEEESKIVMFACSDEQSGERILKNAKTDWSGKTVATHGERAREALKNVFPSAREFVRCYQVVYLKPSFSYVPTDLVFKKATEKEMDVIKAVYDKEPTEVLEKLYRQGKIHCAFLPEERGGDFVGFIGYHPEGSMGLLLIFEKYRRLGYGEALENYLIGQTLNEGRTPYAHIKTDNEASLRLQERLGFSRSEETITWWKIQKEAGQGTK